MKRLVAMKWRRLHALCFCLLLSTGNIGCSPAPPSGVNVLERLRYELRRSLADMGGDRAASFVDRLAPPKSNWSAMTKAQKRRHMEQSIMPVLSVLYLYSAKQRRPLFKRWGSYIHKGRLPDRLDCKTCHGGGPADQFEPDFAKPSTLFPLDPQNMPTENDKDAYVAASVRFMKEIVTPAMAIMLDRPAFSCFGCHAKK